MRLFSFNRVTQPWGDAFFILDLLTFHTSRKSRTLLQLFLQYWEPPEARELLVRASIRLSPNEPNMGWMSIDLQVWQYSLSLAVLATPWVDIDHA